MLSVIQQTQAFSIMMICGATVGLFFDVLEVSRSHFRFGKWMGAVSDLLFWMMTVAVLSAGLLTANGAVLRIFVLAGFLSGVGLYYGLAHVTAFHLLQVVLHITGYIFDRIAFIFDRCILCPIVFIYRTILKIPMIILWSKKN